MSRVREAPTFYPTVEEFKNPLEFIAKIRKEAENAGICKIVPPSGWKPPFSVDMESFRFRTRVQNLCKIDGIARIEREFLMDVRKYLFKKGVPMGENPLPLVPKDSDGRKRVPIRLYRLFSVVESLGGGAHVATNDLWNDVAREMFAWQQKQWSQFEPIVKDCYERYLMAYELERSISEEEQVRMAAKNKLDLSQFSEEEILKRATLGSANGYHATLLGTHCSQTSSHGVEQGRIQAQQAKDPSFEYEQIEVVHVVSGNSMGQRPQRTESSSSSSNGVSTMKKKKGSGKRHVSEKCTTVRVKKRRVAPRVGPPPIPEPAAGATFFRYFENVNMCLLGEIISMDEEDDEYRIHYVFNDQSRAFSHEEIVDKDTIVMYLASGETEELAREASLEGICQVCLRADRPDEMLLCDECNFGYHANCITPPCRQLPSGDWFCSVCTEENDDDDEEEEEEEEEEVEKVEETQKKKKKKKEETDIPRTKMQTSMPNLGKSKTQSRLAKIIARFGYDEGKDYTIEEFREMSNTFRDNYLRRAKNAQNQYVLEYDEAKGTEAGDRALEREYWRLISDAARTDTELVDLKVSYGSDLDTGVMGSGFPKKSKLSHLQEQLQELIDRQKKRESNAGRKSEQYVRLQEEIDELKQYVEDGWNLNNFPKLSGSLLQYVDEDITGVIVPWLYMGMFFSSFCWHTEDHYFASINYHHWGEPKTWYGVPSKAAEAFEAAAEQLTPELFKARPDILTGIVTQYNPIELAHAGVDVYHTIQREGDFVITFPQAYHGGFNHGINCAEAVNFATANWLPYGDDCVVRYASLKKNPVISHDALLVSLAAISTLDHLDNDDKLGATNGELARDVFLRLSNLVQQELTRRTTLSRNLKLKIVDFDDHLLDNHHQQNGEETKSHDEDEDMSNPQQQHSSNNNHHKHTKKVYGRERSHMSRLGGAQAISTKAPGDVGHLVQVQCAECRRFCSLSFCLTKHGEVYCLDHASPNHEVDDDMELVVVWNENRLKGLLDKTGNRALALGLWRERVFETVNSLLDEEEKAGMIGQFNLTASVETLSALATMNGTSPPLDGLPPGAIYTIQHYDGKQKIPAKMIKELIDAGLREYHVPKDSQEIAYLRDITEQVEAYCDRITTVLDNSKNATEPGNWYTLPDLTRLLGEADTKHKVDVTDMDVLKKLATLVDRATKWKADVENALELFPLDKISPEEMLRLQNEMAEELHVRVDPEYQRLKQLGAVIEWMVDTEKLLTFGSEIELALEHIENGKKLNLTRTSEKEMLQKLQDSVDEAQAGMDKIWGYLEEKNPVKILEMKEWAQKIPFKTRKVIDRFRRRYVVLETWLSKTNEYQNGTNSVPASSAPMEVDKEEEEDDESEEPNRMKYVDFDKFLTDGKRLGFTPETAPQMKTFIDGEINVAQWRQNAVSKLLDVVQPTDLEFQPRPVEELILALLRYVVAAVDKDMRAQELPPPNGDDVASIKFKTVLIAPRHKKKEKPVFCICRMPEISNVFMFACDVCNEWYHPECFGTTREKIERHGRFTCPTCVYDGKLVMDNSSALANSKKKGGEVYCYCRQRYSKKDLMIECETCKQWFHPFCVGMSDIEALQLNGYKCPDCCIKNGQHPMVNLYCKCRKPDFGLSQFSTTMLGCEDCGDWLHPVCMGIDSEESIRKFSDENEGIQFYCETCCLKNDMPYFIETGQSGFRAAHQFYDKLRHKDDDKFTLKLIGDPSNTVYRLRKGIHFDELVSLYNEAKGLCTILPEEHVLKSIIKAGRLYMSKLGKIGDFSKLDNVVLWKLFYQQATFPFILPGKVMYPLKFEIWKRFALHAFGKDNSKRPTLSPAGSRKAMVVLRTMYEEEAGFMDYVFDQLEKNKMTYMLKDVCPTPTASSSSSDDTVAIGTWDHRCTTALQRYWANQTKGHYRELENLHDEISKNPTKKQQKLISKLKQIITKIK